MLHFIQYDHHTTDSIHVYVVHSSEYVCVCVCIVKVSNRNRECENERKYEKNALSSQPEHSLSRESTSKIFRGIKFIPNLCAVYTKTKNGRSFNSYAYFQDLLNV